MKRAKWFYSDQSDCGPKEGDLLDCGNEEYKIYHRGKWKPIDYTQVQKPFALGWYEYTQIPFRETLQDDLQLRKKYNLPVERKRVEDFRKVGKISDKEIEFLKVNKLIKE